MSHLTDINKELQKIHANHQLRKITTALAEKLDNQQNVIDEFNERLSDIEETKSKEASKAP